MFNGFWAQNKSDSEDKAEIQQSFCIYSFAFYMQKQSLCDMDYSIFKPKYLDKESEVYM